jgi:hypothetical protein
MQEQLSWLTVTLEGAKLGRANIPARPRFDIEPVGSMPAPFHSNDTAAARTTAGHIIRDGGTQIERYYGPWTRVALCRDFQADLASGVGSASDEVVDGLVNQMLLDATGADDDYLDLQARPDTTIYLPPRQLLSVTLNGFLKQADYSTDIFCHQTIYEAVDRIYKDPSSPISEPWILCFNLIILISLGGEHPVFREDPFLWPIFQATHAAVRKPSLFMVPRLVNIQALALFVSNELSPATDRIRHCIVNMGSFPANTVQSLLAQQYHPNNEILGDSILAQACILTKESGLHQAGRGIGPASSLTAIEAEERQKVFESLYIRDRYSMTACGTFTWLPQGSPPTSTSGVSAPAPHWELANVQDELYRLLGSADALEMTTSGRSLSRLQHKLETWAQTHDIPSSTRPTTVDALSLHLSFLGARIRLLNNNNSTGDVARQASAQVLYDARLSCLLVATSCSHCPDPTLVGLLDHLLDKTSPDEVRTRSSSTTSSTRQLSTHSSAPFSSAIDTLQRTGPLPPSLSSGSLGQATVSPISIYRLAKVFPVSATFVLARHILSLDSPPQSSQSVPTRAQTKEPKRHETNEDIVLLEALLFCFRKAPSPAAHGKVDSDINSSKLGRMIQRLVDIIHAIVGPTAQDGTNAPDGDGDDDEDDDDVYGPKPPLASTSSLLRDPAGAIEMPNFDFYDSGSANLSSPLLHLQPPPSSSSSSQSTWATPQDSLSSSAMELLGATQSSLYAPSITPTPPTIPGAPFDISHFLQQTDTSSRLMWHRGQEQAELHMLQQQRSQGVPETMKRRSRKRPRTDGTRD